MTTSLTWPAFEKLAQQGDAFFGLLWKNILMDRRLATRLNQYPGVGSFYQSLADQPVRTILQEATPFLWQYVFKLLDSDKSVRTEIAFLQHLIDSFHPLIQGPVSMSIVNIGQQESTFTLPKAGLSITVIDKLTLHVEQGRLHVIGKEHNLPAEPGDVFATLPGYAGKVIVARDLFDPVSAAKIDQKAANTCADQVAGGLALIERFDPDLARLIQKTIQYYVPVVLMKAGQHHSFMSKAYPGVIFLSASTNPLLIAEAIVHEYAHTELDQITAFEPIVSGTDNAIYYSPWRSDARPMQGLFHAVYVFFKVYAFLEMIDLQRLTASEQAYLIYRREIIRWRLQIGMAQIPPGLLSPICQSILNCIDAALRPTMQGAQLRHSPAYPTLATHMDEWINQHPDKLIKFTINP